LTIGTLLRDERQCNVQMNMKVSELDEKSCEKANEEVGPKTFQANSLPSWTLV
jgi:hypothetical protein